MGATALSFRVAAMMAIVLATAAGHFAVSALWIVGRWFFDLKRRLGVLVRSAWAALADASRRLC